MDLFVKIFQMIYTFIYQNYWWINLVLVLTIIYWGRERPARSTFMWILVMTLLPIVGFFPYLLLGQDTRRTNMFRIKAEQDRFIREESEIQEKMLEDLPDIFDDYEKRATIGEVGELATLNLRLNQSVLSADNDVRVFTDGQEKFDALIKDIDHAQHSIEVQYYIFKSDGLGTRLINHLVQAAGRGVRVRLLTDGIGCRFISKREFRRMKESGIEVGIFFPSFLRIINLRMNYRNHRKIVVVDGDTGFIGGLNFADRYLHGLPGIGIWRDTHLKVKGEAVTSLQVVFLFDWYFVRQELLLNKAEYLPNKKVDGNVVVQTVASGPDSDWTSIQQAYFTLINMAKKYVFISTPYFMPGETTINSLKTAAMSGVDVRIMIPYKSDSLLTHWCTRSYVEELLEAGVRVFQYRKGFNHSKVIVMDGLVSSVGTANMDIRSFEQNFEVNLIIYDRNVSRQLGSDFLDDLKGSSEISIHRWKFRPKRDKIRESLARLFAPLL